VVQFAPHIFAEEIHLEWRKLDHIVAFRRSGGLPVAFHTKTLEVAQLSDEAWAAMQVSSASGERLSELLTWSAQDSESDTRTTKENNISSLAINVTQVCNLHCTYCAAGGDGTYGDPIKKITIEKTLPQIQYFLSKAPKNSDFFISFIGGEPLLYPEALSSIGKYAKEVAAENDINLTLAITTNGTLLNETTVKALKDINAAVTVSLDGPDEINDIRRPGLSGKGMTRKVVDGIQLLVAARPYVKSIGLSAVFDENYLDVVNTYKFFSELNVDWYEFTYTHTNADRASSLAFAEQMGELAKLALNKGGEAELRRIKFFNTHFKNLDNQIKVENFCGAGKTSLVIDARNNLYTCPWMVGDSAEQVGENIMLSEKRLATYKNNLVETNNCGECWARYLCGGGCMAINKAAHSMIALAIEYYLVSKISA
jgi:uncharacterized protein